MVLGERFWSKVNKAGTCWVWTATTNASGYGMFKIDGSMRLSHRLAVQSTGVSIPTGVCVLHKCDNPPCVRPDHLFLGTRADNTRDMIAKKRDAHSKGIHRSNAKLTISQVKAVRREAKDNKNINIAALARKYNVGWTAIKEIITRQTWKDI